MSNAPLALVFWVSTWEVSHALKKHTTVIAIVDLLGTPLAAPALDSPTVHDARKMVVNAARPTLRPPPPHGGAPLRHTRPLLLLSLADRYRARAVAAACPQATDQAINTNQHSSCS